MSLDVLIGQAYFLRFDPALWAAGQPYAPLGALYAAAVARQHGFRVALFDAMLAVSEVEWTAALERDRPAVAVLYEDNFNYLSKMCLLRMRTAAVAMIGAARARGIPVVVAGSDASDHAEVYLDAGADLVVVGEGEATLVAVLAVLRGRERRPVTSIDGLAFREGARVVRTTPRAIDRHLDRLPRPAWDLVDVDRYRAMWRRHGYFSMNIATTRGCPYHCNWCAKPIYGQRYNARSPESVVEEVGWLMRTYRPDHLWIADDIFGLRPGWIERFARLAVDAGAVVPFKCLMRADGVTSGTARALAEAGCRTVWIGAESGSQRVLDAMEKGIGVDQIVGAARLLRAAGIEVGFFLQFGYPGETWDDIELTLSMIRRCRPDDIGVSVSYPLPGTPFFERVRAELGVKRHWNDSADLALMFRGAYAPEFYRMLHRRVHAEFKARRAWATLTGASRRPLRGRELMAGASQAMRLPLLAWRTRSLARRTRTEAAPQHGPAIVPLLSRSAAALPSEQSR